MALLLPKATLVLLLLSIFLVSAIAAGSLEEEEFHEELLLKPLPDRKVLSHFHLQSEAPLSDSFTRHHVFPKSISQLCWMDRFRNFILKQWSYHSHKVGGTMKDGVDLIQYQATMQSFLELNCGQSLMSLHIRLMLLGKIEPMLCQVSFVLQSAS